MRTSKWLRWCAALLLVAAVGCGSDTPAGWSMGISIDQHLRNKLQQDPSTQTRFGSLEFGVMVPDRADTWTRWSYAGPNQPIGSRLNSPSTTPLSWSSLG